MFSPFVETTPLIAQDGPALPLWLRTALDLWPSYPPLWALELQASITMFCLLQDLGDQALRLL